MTAEFRVRIADWSRDESKLKALRYDVFVIEQHVPAEIEWDGIDAGSCHAIAEDVAGNAIGCGRLLPDGHIGRMAVRREWRGRGVGGVLLERLVELARELGHARVVLNAQTHALPFYARFGFAPCGPEYLEAGIAHQAMVRTLD
jgi:predicted GNAT family N-acyltransferase